MSFSFMEGKGNDSAYPIDPFIGSLSSLDASNAIIERIHDVFQDAKILTFPLAGGGEGTVEAIVLANHGELIEKEVTAPLGEYIMGMETKLENADFWNERRKALTDKPQWERDLWGLQNWLQRKISRLLHWREELPSRQQC